MGEGGGGGEFPPKKDGVEEGFPAKKPARQLDFTSGSDEYSLSKAAAAPTVVATAVKPIVTTTAVPSTIRPGMTVAIGQVRPMLPVVTTPIPPSQSQILTAPIRHP